MGADEITAFLTHLAVKGKVSASTQNVAFNSLLFLHMRALEIELLPIEGIFRASAIEASGGFLAV